MKIGVPKEIKNNENRVALTPAGVHTLVRAGHQVRIESKAGEGCGFADGDYAHEGALIVSQAETWNDSEMVMKVKEPLPAEYGFFREGLVLFTYLHLAAEPELVQAMLQKKVVGIAYETVQTQNGALPLLAPMSEIAGRMAPQIGAQFLEKHYGGGGILLGGVPGVQAASVVIVGGGAVGTNAAKLALGMGARVTIFDKNADRLRYLDDIFGGRIQTLMSNSYELAKAVESADLLIGAVLIPGAKAPKLVTDDMVKTMKKGSVIVDVAIDQGGSIETIDRITTHDNPVYVKHGVVHYAVANMPGAVARTSTMALTNSTLPYAELIARVGWKEAVLNNPALAKGVNTVHGHLTHEAVAESLGLSFLDFRELTA
jgi:alanine dehydrogenase